LSSEKQAEPSKTSALEAFRNAAQHLVKLGMNYRDLHQEIEKL
jgi:hypothetical protein